MNVVFVAGRKVGATDWRLHFDEYIARMVVEVCIERGLSIPGDVAIIAGQNEEIICENGNPLDQH